MKAILVMDLPKNCRECMCNPEAMGYDVCIANEDIEPNKYGKKQRPKKCPLKPVNEKSIRLLEWADMPTLRGAV